ncbi:MAG: 50S ribosomal protein L33 [Bacteroidia bacterium]|nr:50S ribosomal protein L33 [Bacteroidia bacterium]
MAKKSKGNRVQVILESIENNAEGKAMVSRYVTTKNKKNTPERMERKKFHAGVGRVTVHKEIK